MTDLERQLDPIGPLGPRPPPPDAVIEVGRWPIEIEGGQIAEYDDLEMTRVRRAYSYRRPEAPGMHKGDGK